MSYEPPLNDDVFELDDIDIEEDESMLDELLGDDDMDRMWGDD